MIAAVPLAYDLAGAACDALRGVTMSRRAVLARERNVMSEEIESANALLAELARLRTDLDLLRAAHAQQGRALAAERQARARADAAAAVLRWGLDGTIDIEALTTAAEYVGTLDNMAGQLCQMKDGKPHLLLFELGCPNCSEVQSRNADEWGDAFQLLINSVPELLTGLAAERELRSRSEMIVLAARRLVAGPDSAAYTTLAAAIDAYDEAAKARQP